MQVFFPDKESFETTVEKVFERILENKLPKIISKATAKDYYNIEEVCSLLGVTRRHLQHLRTEGLIGYVKQGRKVYFRREDLEEFFDRNYIEAKDTDN